MERIEAAICEFHARASDMERVTSTLDSVLKMAPESDMYGAAWALIGGYIEALGAAYHIDGWLEWWWNECGLGDRPHEAAPAGGELRMIATVDDLVQLIREDLAHDTEHQQ